jgi:hypothetical protein
MRSDQFSVCLTRGCVRNTVGTSVLIVRRRLRSILEPDDDPFAEQCQRPRARDPPLSLAERPGHPIAVRYNRSVVLGMDRVENIEGQVRSLSSEELKAFREWFATFDAEAWDTQIEADAKNGKLRPLAERALRDHESGRSTLL